MWCCFTLRQCETGHRLDPRVATSHKCHAVLILIHKKCRLDICLTERAVAHLRESLFSKAVLELLRLQQTKIFPKKSDIVI